MVNLPLSASFHSLEKIAVSKLGIKHLGSLSSLEFVDGSGSGEGTPVDRAAAFVSAARKVSEELGLRLRPTIYCQRQRRERLCVCAARGQRHKG